MSLYLDTQGQSVIAIAICDRCKRKFSWTQLYSDPNSPGLRVCLEDLDQLDPYRLPARQTETITMQWARPDAPLGTNPAGLVTEDDDNFLIGSPNEYLIP